MAKITEAECLLSLTLQKALCADGVKVLELGEGGRRVLRRVRVLSRTGAGAGLDWIWIGSGSGLEQVWQVAVDRVQQGLTGLLALDPRDLEQAVQFVLRTGDLLEGVQLLRVQDVQHVVEDGL